MTAEQKLEAAFRSGLALSPRIDVTTVSAVTSRNWDSVAHLQLVGAIEKAFSVLLPPGDVIDLNSYSSAIAILQRLSAWHDD